MLSLRSYLAEPLPSRVEQVHVFNLATDSYETRNLINDPDLQSILQTMNDALDVEKAKVHYHVPPYADPVP